MHDDRSSPESADSPDGPCFYCGEPTVSYAGNPGLWPLRFCQRDGTGITRYHHTHCVTDRLNANAQPSPESGVTVTIIANGDNENTPAEAVHHALEYPRKAGFIEGWSDPVAPAQCAPRQPTDAMLKAARDWSIAKFHRGIGDDAAIGCWQAMFDASTVTSTIGAAQCAQQPVAWLCEDLIGTPPPREVCFDQLVVARRRLFPEDWRITPLYALTSTNSGWPPSFEPMKLQARSPDGGDWTDIFPAQLGWMAKNGNDVRAVEPPSTVTRPDGETP